MRNNRVALRRLPGRARFKRIAALFGAVAIASLSSSATAASEPSTKVIRCGEQSCLVISGHRENPSSIVRINGHAVSVKGKYGWKVRLPVETVRRWSNPYARTIEVTLHDPETESATIASVRLPLGLLGNLTDLEPLVISLN